MQKYEKKIKPR